LLLVERNNPWGDELIDTPGALNQIGALGRGCSLPGETMTAPFPFTAESIGNGMVSGGRRSCPDPLSLAPAGAASVSRAIAWTPAISVRTLVAPR